MSFGIEFSVPKINSELKCVLEENVTEQTR